MKFSLFKNINLKQKIFICLLLLALILFLSLFFVIFPAIENMKTITTETEQMKKDIKITQEIDNSFSLEDYQEVKSQIGLLNNVFIKEEETKKFVQTLESIADLNGVNQDAHLMKTEEVENDFYYSTPLQISLNGEIENLLNYLNDLQKINYYININKVELTKNSLRNISNRNLVENVGSGMSLNIFANTFWIN